MRYASMMEEIVWNTMINILIVLLQILIGLAVEGAGCHTTLRSVVMMEEIVANLI